MCKHNTSMQQGSEYMHQEILIRAFVKRNDDVLLCRAPQEVNSTTEFYEIPGQILSAGQSPSDAWIQLRNSLLHTPELNDDIITTYSYVKDSVQRIGICYVIDIQDELSEPSQGLRWFNIRQLDAVRLTDESRFVLKSVLQKLPNTTTPAANDMHMLKLFTDGGSRGNPGPSALGYVIYGTDDSVIKKGSKYLGITTNNQAEYQAVRHGLEECLALGAKRVEVFMDSQLVARQMTGVYKIKNRDLWPIHLAIKALCARFVGGVGFTYVPREFNKEADAMVNEALDSYVNS